MEIDFSQGNDLIEKQFHDWLDHRRRELEQLFPEGPWAVAAKPTRNKMNVGQRGNCRTYEAWFNALAAYRFMRHYNNDYKKCADATEDVLGRPLYNSNSKSSWTVATEKAKDLLKRFEIAWQFSYFPPFILSPNHYYESLHASTLGKSLPAS